MGRVPWTLFFVEVRIEASYSFQELNARNSLKQNFVPALARGLWTRLSQSDITAASNCSGGNNKPPLTDPAEVRGGDFSMPPKFVIRVCRCGRRNGHKRDKVRLPCDERNRHVAEVHGTDAEHVVKYAVPEQKLKNDPRQLGLGI
jgi:hypothetical protein